MLIHQIEQQQQLLILVLLVFFFPDSLGIFYEMMTQLLGFKNYGDEYKLMGLSSYGRPTYKEIIFNRLFDNSKILKLNTQYFSHIEKDFAYKFNGIPKQNQIYNNINLDLNWVESSDIKNLKDLENKLGKTNGILIPGEN